jgi:hypothetical protein
MTRGRSATVQAAVTLGQTVPANRVLHQKGAIGRPGLLVSCRVEAKLSASRYDFGVDPTNWVSRSFLSSDTEHWLWYVTPKIGGVHTVVLYVRPIVSVRRLRSGAAESTLAANSDVQQYEISVRVHVPWTQRPQEMMSRLAATFKVAQSLVEAVSGLIAALLALAGAVGIRRRRGERPPAKSAQLGA